MFSYDYLITPSKSLFFGYNLFSKLSDVLEMSVTELSIYPFNVPTKAWWSSVLDYHELDSFTDFYYKSYTSSSTASIKSTKGKSDIICNSARVNTIFDHDLSFLKASIYLLC